MPAHLPWSPTPSCSTGSSSATSNAEPALMLRIVRSRRQSEIIGYFEFGSLLYYVIDHEGEAVWRVYGPGACVGIFRAVGQLELR